MSLEDRIKHHPPFAALPLWRRLVLIVGFAFFVLVLVMTSSTKADLYGSDPDHPISATGHVFPVTLFWGQVRYATHEEHERVYSWNRELGDWIGLPPLAAVFLWLLYKPERETDA